LLTVSTSFMNVANSVLWRMTIILKANKVNLFVSSVLFVLWYHSPNVLDTPRITVCTVLQIKLNYKRSYTFRSFWNYLQGALILRLLNLYNVKIIKIT
jgi:hypothetical protein